jgi:AsmA protein
LELKNASVYGGYLNGEMKINFSGFHPSVTAHVKGVNMQVEPLFKLLQSSHVNIYPETKIYGNANIEFDVATTATEPKNMLNNLNGTSHLSISNGVYLGKDWDDIVTKLVAAKHTISTETILETLRIFRFKQLVVTFKINHGIFSSDDLLIDSSDLKITGKGQINLPNNFMDYVLQAEFQNDYNNLTTIPIRAAWIGNEG